MPEKIVEPMTPTGLDPAPAPVLAGVWKDDDAEVYEQDFIAADHGPGKPMGVSHPVEKLPVATRLISRRVSVGTIGGVVSDPVLLFPADTKRKHLHIWTQDGEPVYIGSDKSSVQSALNAYSMIYNGVVWEFKNDYHTGAVWVWCTDNNAVELVAYAVTE